MLEGTPSATAAVASRVASVDHISLYSPLYGRVHREGLVTCCFSLSGATRDVSSSSRFRTLNPTEHMKLEGGGNEISQTVAIERLKTVAQTWIIFQDSG